jgi:hypothetical protein
MPKKLDAPITIYQDVFRAQLFQITGYAVMVEPEISVRRFAKASSLDPDGNVVETRPLAEAVATGDAAQTQMADAGVNVVLETIAVLQLSDTATIAELKAALATNPNAGGAGYYAGTKIALYRAFPQST